MMMKSKRIFYLGFLSLVVFLAGCNNNEKSVVDHYYLSLVGESQTWALTGYEVMITPENLQAGNGTLNIKNQNEYITDSFHFETHAVINNEDLVIHSGSVSGVDVDIAEETTGAIEGGTYLNKDGNPITLNEISDMYMIIEWWDKDESKSVKERIDIYIKPNKERTFLN